MIPPKTAVPIKSNAPDTLTTPPQQTALERVQAAWQQAGQFSGNGAGPDERGKLLTKALAEIDGCMEALCFAEHALIDQNEALEKFQLALREERLHHKAVLTAMPHAIIVTDIEGVVRTANLAATQVLGIGARFLVGKPFTQQARKGKQAHFLRVIKQALVTNGCAEGLKLRTRNGLAPATATAYVIKNEAGVSTGLLWLLKVPVEDAPVEEGLVEPAFVQEALVQEALAGKGS